jgi:WhiB family redox-sensing transcriptional regulator
VGPELFFGDPYTDHVEAKKVCRQCAVQTICLEYALARPEKHGVWGGVSEAGRRKILKQRAIRKVPNDTVLT